MFLAAIPLAAVCLALSPPADDALAEKARAALQTHCGGCHGPGVPARGGFDYVLDRDRLVARGKVAPGKAAESLLYERVLKGEMPPPGKRPPVASDDLALLRRWIDAGAPAVAAADGPRQPLSDTALTQMVRADLQALEPRQRRFARYLTLAHLPAGGASEDDVSLHRAALAKLLNSLSWHPRITKPAPIDANATVFRIDLRDYKWTARMWDRLAAAYPYRLPKPGEAARAGAPQPVLRGDWFLANASRPPLYHDLLQLPATDRALERLLQVDVPGDIQDDAVARAGFNGSGVARNNRLLERHDADHGAYWRSYDFSDNSGRQNLFERPLGPGPGGFVQAGGEIIFHLPNGFQGYLLVDGAGRRLDKAPLDIVSDPKRPDHQVETGVSCMGCHVRGLLPKDDQVRAHVLKNPDAFSRADREAVRALFPPPARLRALVDEDNERFARALARAGVAEGEPEPISFAVQRYEAVLDLRAAAAEAGLTPDDFSGRLRKSPTLSRSLGDLLVQGGTVQRALFEETYPELARTFRLGEDSGPSVAAVAPSAPFAGHTGSVVALAFSADGKCAVSCGEDKTVRLWDVDTGRELRCFEGHGDEVLAAAVSADGRRVLSGGRDRTVRLWDADSGREVRRFPGHTDAVRCVAFSPDGRQALTAGDDRTLRLWDVEKGKEIDCFTGHSGAVTAVVFSPDGRSALSASRDRTVRLWDLTAGKEKARWDGHTAEVYCVAFSADGRQALSGGGDRTVRLWDVETGKETRRFTGHANAVVRVAFTADGRILSAGSQYRMTDRVVRLWDPADGHELRGWDGDGLERVECAAFSPKGDRVLLGRGAGGLVLWKLSEPR